MRDNRVVIIGGGIGGLAAALALLKRGLDVEVHEQAPELTLGFWAGVLAPAHTPADIVTKLNAAINETLRSPEMKENMAKIGMAAKIGSPQDFAKFMAEEMPRWAEIVKTTGVTFQ